MRDVPPHRLSQGTAIRRPWAAASGLSLGRGDWDSMHCRHFTHARRRLFYAVTLSSHGAATSMSVFWQLFQITRRYVALRELLRCRAELALYSKPSGTTAS